MWVVVIVLLNALSGPDVHVVKEAAYASEDACKASIARTPLAARLGFDTWFVVWG